MKTHAKNTESCILKNVRRKLCRLDEHSKIEDRQELYSCSNLNICKV